MTDETIVAVFDDAARAAAAVRDLGTAQLPSDAISVHVAGMTDAAAAEGAGAHAGFWTDVFGGEPDHDTSIYQRSLAEGSTIVAVRVPHEHVARVTGMLETHHPVDLDERAASYGLRPVPHPDTMPIPTAGGSAASGAMTDGAMAPGPAEAGSLQLSEERLVVGRRVVSRGGTRIRRFVVMTPVERQVTLHDEEVAVERRLVTDDRPFEAATAFTDQVVEMMESREELVVSKTVRVVEEITLRRQVTERVETVRDTVRREDVEVGPTSDAPARPGVGPVVTNTSDRRP